MEISMTKEDILDYIRKHREDLSKFGVERIGLFGSFANNKNTNKSDIDILVKFGNTSSKFYSYFDLKNYLQDNLNLEVDLCREEDIRKEFKEEILKNVIYV